MRPKKNNTKESHVITKCRFLEVVQFPGTYFVFFFSKRIFAECRSTRSLWCLEKNQGPIWRSKDHLVMEGLSKNVGNHDF